MGRLKYVMFSLFAFGIITSANAATCGYEEKAKLNSEIGNVKANYEIKTKVDEGATPPDAILGTEAEKTYVPMKEYIQVNILNLTENIYAEVTNDYDKNKIIYNYSETNNGNISFDWETLGKLVTYTIVIKASDNTGCAGTTLRTIKVSLPRYNDYSTYAVCTQVPDYYLCQRYVTFKEISFYEFSEKITQQIEKLEKEKETEEDNDKWYQEVGSFVENHKVAFIAGGIILVVIAGVTTFVIIKRRRSSII